MDQQSEIQEALPLREATFFIMLSIATRPMHGYAILKEVETISGGRVVIGAGTLYGAIKRLLTAGWIERIELDAPPENSREKKAYQLTDLGRRIFDEEVSRLKNLVDLAQQQAAGGKA